MKRIAQLLFVTILLAGFQRSIAQDGKITVEIIKEINGEKRTFKGEYENAEQMKADPNYKEFAGEDGSFNFWYGGDEDNDPFFRLDQFDQFNAFPFAFGDGDEPFQGLDILKYLRGDSIFGSSKFFQLNGDDWEEREENIESLQNEIGNLLEQFSEDEDTNLNSRGIEFSEVEGNELGKKGAVKNSNQLSLEGLRFTPSSRTAGKFQIRFGVPQEGELAIKVSNTAGKEIYSRYFESFGGTFIESIDLSKQQEGKYLLEVSQGKKRLTRKITLK